MKLNCLVATAFDGVETELDRLFNEFQCEYIPDLKLPSVGYEDFDILVVNPNNLRWRLDSSTLDNFNDLKYVLTISTGIAHIDLNYINERGIKLVSLKNSTNEMSDITATAELAFLFFMAKSRKFSLSTSLESVWKWDWRESIGKQLNEQIVGVIGRGRLGNLFSKYCKAFGCSVLWYDPNIQGGESSINDIFRKCDVVSIHASFKPGSAFIVDKEVLNAAKNDLHIINTARGELVDEEALVKFLELNKLSHYSADVISNEQNKNDSVLFKYFLNGGNVTLTPHVGGMTTRSRQRAYNLGVTKFLNHIDKINGK